MDGDSHRDQGLRPARGTGVHADMRTNTGPTRRARRVWGPRAVLLGPGVAWWLVFFLVPVGVLIAYSFFSRGAYGGVIYEFTLKNYRRALDPLYVGVLWTSIRIASIATLAALLLAYPAALFIARATPRWRVPLLVLVILPFWTSFLIRTYSWMVLLNPAGLINRVLIGIGLIDEPLPLLYNEFAVTLGLVYAYLPLMVLPIYASLERLGPQTAEAAADLYATPWLTLRKVTVPAHAAGHRGGVHLRLRAEPRELHRAGSARGREDGDDRQRDPAAVPDGA